ncbi:MAG: hypothetical protein SFX72_16515 [Isosphaeraceae bacterium]|nr:hypothetical protein [Isosphaeraceae bacterium]
MSMTRQEKQRQIRVIALAMVVLTIFTVLAFDPALRPTTLGLIVLVGGGFLLLGVGMALGALGMGMRWGFEGKPRATEREEAEWAEFRDVVPAAKPSGPSPLQRAVLPSIVGFLVVVEALSLAKDPFGLLNALIIGALFAFGVFVILAMLAGITMLVSRTVREFARNLWNAGETSSTR